MRFLCFCRHFWLRCSNSLIRTLVPGYMYLFGIESDNYVHFTYVTCNKIRSKRHYCTIFIALVPSVYFDDESSYRTVRLRACHLKMWSQKIDWTVGFDRVTNQLNTNFKLTCIAATVSYALFETSVDLTINPQCRRASFETCRIVLCIGHYQKTQNYKYKYKETHGRCRRKFCRLTQSQYLQMMMMMHY